MSEFFTMNGYGFFVWSCFGLTALLIFMEILILRRQRHKVIQRLRRMSDVNHPTH